MSRVPVSPAADAAEFSSTEQCASESGPGRQTPHRARAALAPDRATATLKGPAVCSVYATSSSPLPLSVTVPAEGEARIPCSGPYLLTKRLTRLQRVI